MTTAIIIASVCAMLTACTVAGLRFAVATEQPADDEARRRALWARHHRRCERKFAKEAARYDLRRCDTSGDSRRALRHRCLAEQIKDGVRECPPGEP